MSSYSVRGNYSLLYLTLYTVTFGNSTYRCGNYSREETIQGRKLYEEIRYGLLKLQTQKVLVRQILIFVQRWAKLWLDYKCKDYDSMDDKLLKLKARKVWVQA